MLLPTTTVRAPFSASYAGRSLSPNTIGDSNTGLDVYAPIFISKHNVEIPSYFHQQRVGRGNNVVHAKTKGALLQGSNYNYFLGRSSTVFSREKSTRYWLHEYHDGVTYTIRVLTSYTSSAIRNDVSLSRTKYLSSDDRYVYGLSSDISLVMITDSSSHYISSSTSHGLSITDQDWVKLAVLSCHPDFSQKGHVNEYSLASEIMDLLLSYSYHSSDGREFATPMRELEHVNPSTPSDLSAAFLIGEPEYVFFGYAVGLKSYWLKTLIQGAFMSMIDSMPALNDNSLSNIAGLCSLLKSIIIDHKPNIPSSLSDAWLAYRYSYGTTRLDINEAIRFAKRVSDGALGRDLQLYGSSSVLYQDIIITCRCTGIVSQKEMDWLSKIVNSLYRYGLSPSFYVVWDSIPYSFIVDWFIPVGNILHEQDNFLMYTRNYEFTDMWYSISYDSCIGDLPVHVYSRWQGQVPSSYHGYYSLENKGTTSDKTLGFRILDVMSLAFR